MLAMVVFGVGELLGCFFIGVIIDKWGSRVATVVIVIICLVMMGFTFIFLIVYEYGVWAYLMCFMWGI